MNTQLKSGIDWVGYLDWNVRDFHSYDTARGATYNAYLVRDEKTALIDTVKAPYADHLLRNLRERTSLDKIDYLVCNHSELDHAGALPEVLRHLPNATLLCNAKCKETLGTFFDISGWKIQLVGPEETVSLGCRSLAFVNTPMVHWPESMFTYIPEEKLLFSMDAFGQHLATTARFDDQWPLEHLLAEAKLYYANIVTPYGRQVLKTLEAAATIPIEMIAPSHGLIWRTHIGDILAAYGDWAGGRFQKKLLILYDTMWESTEIMAEEILKTVQAVQPDVDVHLMHVRKTSLTRIAAEMLDASAVAVGTSTLNTQMMPQLAAVLTYLRGLKFREKSAFAFGSSGWGPGGPEQVHQCLEQLQWNVIVDPIRAKNRPTEEVLQRCRDAAGQLAAIASQRAANVSF
ncbi:MAG: MBL fold metallo-hydrolase [Planctomycetaceae bacterium]|nr:MBL fold metallo-hydrolase [Planctomycetaceae bacterium]